MPTTKQHAVMMAAGAALATMIFATPVANANAAPDDFGPAAIESADSPRDVGASIDDASGPRDTVTDETPNGAGVLPQSANGPRRVGAPIDSGNSPRPVGK
ncbi:hypothetical protein [Tsukamurella tyrosinosolvens]|uniref:hypothetical protein n=1 Tax=Tsukamurella tyrosinosolvens TaxID=57704 RepID=UPI002DD436A3|nr:hypothetical protein [Tsukamurella tyrosinosolvens]MEC4615774.1 hypothetical protein [Tsukamurella tyrosinosolvens]